MRFSAPILSAITILSAAGAAHAAAPTYNWTGAYIGAVGSYNWSHSQATYDYGPLQTNYPQAAMSAAAAGIGLELGVNYQAPGGFVMGVEGGITFTNLTATIPDDYGNTAHSLTGPHTISSHTDWVADIRGRLGVATNNLLFYGTAGVSSSRTTASATDGPLSETANLTAFLVGAGVEKAISEKVTLKLEYIHSIIGSHTWYSGQLYSATSTGSADSIRVGLNLHF